MTRDPRRAIPGVDRLLADAAFAPLLASEARGRVVAALRAVQGEVRAGLAAGREPPEARDAAWYASAVAARLRAAARPSLRPVLNATGVVLHTNLGRAPLAGAAIEALVQVAGGYANLEYELEGGRRGSRYDHCVGLLRELTGAEDALVVNNNAAAVLLALNTVAEGREAVISRGELVEIGDSFRVAEIMAKSGARIVEVGATNRTHLADYAAALSQATGAILKVHRSNFRITGFVAEATLGELAALAAPRGIPVINDLGSGLLLGPPAAELPHEPTAAEALRAGADLVTMSGDKLLGGPQAGIIAGRSRWIAAMRRNPLARALRPDKLTLAALEATLSLHRDPETARREVPVLRMLGAGAEELAARAHAFAGRLRALGHEAEVVDGASAVGGGAYPGAELPAALVALGGARSAAELERRLRHGEPPVVARITEGRVVLDLRTIAPAEDAALLQAVTDALR